MKAIKYISLGLLAILLAGSIALIAQYIGKQVTTKIGSGALPGTCSIGDTIFKTDAVAGSNLYGCTAVNTWTAQGGSGTGALVLLEQHTAAGSATLDFTTTISATYDDYVVEFVDFKLDTSAALLKLRISTDGGATYISTNDYIWSMSGAKQDGVYGGTGSGADSAFAIYPAVADPAAFPNWRVNATIRIMNPGGAAYKSILGISGGLGTSTDFWTHNLAGVCKTTTTVNAFQVLPSAGVLTSGVARAYGITK